MGFVSNRMVTLTILLVIVILHIHNKMVMSKWVSSTAGWVTLTILLVVVILHIHNK